MGSGLLDSLERSASRGSNAERLGALRLIARVPWSGEDRRRAGSILGQAAPQEQRAAMEPNFHPAGFDPDFPLILTERPAQYLPALQVRRFTSRSLRRSRILNPLAKPLRVAVSATSLEAPVSRDELNQAVRKLPDPLAESLVLNRFALLADPRFAEDRENLQGYGNETVMLAAAVRPRGIPRPKPLLQIYRSLFPRAFGFWLDWLQEYRYGMLPNFIPMFAGHLSVSWQLAWSALARPLDDLFDAVNEGLQEEDPQARLAALQFGEMALRYAQEDEPPIFGGGSAPPDRVSLPIILAPPSHAKPPAPPEPTPAADITGEWPVIGTGPSEPAPPSTPPTATAPPEPQPPEPTPPPPGRNADFTFYHQESDGSRGARLAAGAVLQASARYQLEVAVRTVRKGIPAEGETEPIVEPGEKDNVDILVVLDSPDNDFEIPEPVQRLVLPPAGDSRQNAWFRGLQARRRTNGQDELVKLRVRLLYNLNLIEVAVIEAESVSPLEDDSHSRLGLEKPIRFVQFLRERDYKDLKKIRPRSMHVLVSRAAGGFDLSFVLDREGRPDVPLPGTARIPDASLEGSLYGIRKALLGVTLWDAFAASLDCADEIQFARGMNDLARLGRELWTKLFELESGSALYHIGDWLWKHPLPARATIQVSVDPGAYAFVLPWNLLYDRDLPGDPDTPPDPEGFWGVRYQVEQRAAASDLTDEAAHPAGPVELGYLTWPFTETALQEQFLKEMAGRSKGRLGEIRAIDSANDAMTYLTSGAAQIVCFFAHGHTQFQEAARVGFSEADFLEMYQELPADSPLRAAWKGICDDIQNKQYQSDRSWIQLRIGRIYLTQLYQNKGLRLEKSPVVLLNMCESAQLTPSLRESFIHLFLDRGAAAVVGTECSMRPFFAHHFAKELLEGLLGGEPLGEVILDVRRRFLARRNPLGLAYTLFGSPAARFEPALVERAAESEASAPAGD